MLPQCLHEQEQCLHILMWDFNRKAVAEVHGREQGSKGGEGGSLDCLPVALDCWSAGELATSVRCYGRRYIVGCSE